MIDSEKFSETVVVFDRATRNNPATLPVRKLCTDCGVSRTSNPSDCGKACQFINPDYQKFDHNAHGRQRNFQRPDELYFGVIKQMYRARMQVPREGAQWTGITSSLAQKMLLSGMVDAVVTVAPDASDRWKPVPVLVTDPEDIVQCRGMRMGYAPVLALVEQARDLGIRKLAVVGIPCQVYALRALQDEYGFEQLYVVGTPCSDNTETARFHEFLSIIDPQPQSISYLEFRADYHVELRYDDGRQRLIPFLKLPLSKLPSDFFPLTCKTCVDYTNSLADVTVGYMAGSGEQWLIIRNDKGSEIAALLEDEMSLSPLTSSGNRRGSVKGFMKNVERAAGGLPLRSMPDWLRPLMAWLMPKVGPKGLEFARARIDMKAIETVLHLRRERPRNIKAMIPPQTWQVLEPYGLIQGVDEKRGGAGKSSK